MSADIVRTIADTPHDVQVYLLDTLVTRPDLVAELTRLIQERGHPTH